MMTPDRNPMMKRMTKVRKIIFLKNAFTAGPSNKSTYSDKNVSLSYSLEGDKGPSG